MPFGTNLDLQGVHNIFIVIPQFVVTGIASLVFMILDPVKSDIHGHRHPTNVLPPGMEENMTATVRNGDEGMTSLAMRVVYFGGNAARMQKDVDMGRTNAIAVVFQCVSALLRLNLLLITIWWVLSRAPLYI